METFKIDIPPIEEVFDSIGKIRILNLLAVDGELNVTAITDETGLNHTRVLEHLDDLKQISIVQEKKFGRIKIFMLNAQSKAATKLKEFFTDWSFNVHQENRLEREEF